MLPLPINMFLGRSLHSNRLCFLRLDGGRGLGASSLDCWRVNDGRTVAAQTIVRGSRSGHRDALPGNDISWNPQVAAQKAGARHTWVYVPCSEPPRNPHSHYHRGRYAWARGVRRGWTQVSLESRPGQRPRELTCQFPCLRGGSREQGCKCLGGSQHRQYRRRQYCTHWCGTAGVPR